MKKKNFQLSEFEMDLLERSKNDGQYLAKGIIWQLYHKLMFIFGFGSILLILVIFGAMAQNKKGIYIICLISFFFSSLFVTLTCFIAIRKGPSDEKKLGIWKWKMGKNLMSLKFVSFLFFLLTIILTLFQQEVEYPIMIYGIILLLFMMMLFYAIVYHILNHPHKITNGILTGIGSIGFIGILLSPVILFIETQKFSIYFFLIIFFVIIVLIKFVDQINRKDFLNPVQYAVLSYIEPDKLFAAFKERYQSIRNRIKALVIIKKLEDKGEYGIKKYLGEILVKENTSYTKFLWSFFISFIFFIFASVGEGFWQDLLYDPFLKPFLCKFIKILCTK